MIKAAVHADTKYTAEGWVQVDLDLKIPRSMFANPETNPLLEEGESTYSFNMTDIVFSMQ